jgi:alcohol dehydrogenase
MQSAATLAGWAIGSANVGLVHGMSHAIGARYGVPHGTGNAILLPHVIRFNAGRPEAARRLKDVALALGLDVSSKEPVDAAAAAADKVCGLLAATNHPTTLSQVKVPKDELGATSEVAFLDPANLYNARMVLFAGEIEQLYQGAF